MKERRDQKEEENDIGRAERGVHTVGRGLTYEVSYRQQSEKEGGEMWRL